MLTPLARLGPLLHGSATASALAGALAGTALLAGLVAPEMPDILAELEPERERPGVLGERAFTLSEGLSSEGPAPTYGPFFRGRVEFELRPGEQVFLSGSRIHLEPHSVDDRAEISATCDGAPTRGMILDYRQRNGDRLSVAWFEPTELTHLLAPGRCELWINLVDTTPPYRWSSSLYLVIRPQPGQAAFHEPAAPPAPAWLVAARELRPARLLGLGTLLVSLAGLGLLQALRPMGQAASAAGRTMERMAASAAALRVEIRDIRARRSYQVELKPGDVRIVRLAGRSDLLCLTRTRRERSVQIDDMRLPSQPPVALPPIVLTPESPVALRSGLSMELVLERAAA